MAKPKQFVDVLVNKNLDALGAILGSIESKHDDEEDDRPAEFLAKLSKEIKVVKLIIDLYKLAAKQGDSLKEEAEHWQQIESNYSNLSVNLRRALKPKLVELREHLKYNEVKDSAWDVKSDEWDDEVDYDTTLNPPKSK